jgi:hypothetical protein
MKVVVHSRLESFLLRSRRGEKVTPGLSPVASERGVALIITLILLAVITFMAIAFLVLSRGQKTSVTITTDMTVARGAAENALARAEAEMLAPILAWTNPMNMGMLVSTNYINPFGFTRGSGAALTSPTNVGYFYQNGLPLNAGGDALQNLANLLYNPRPPVFITNRLRGGYDFRYYLDLNRNGNFDPTGFVGTTNDSGQPLFNLDRSLAVSYQVGDPQWIGGLEFPDRPHSANNRFTYRYAYAVVPISQALDINYIHNQARRPEKTTIDPFGEDFLRNQGVGSWEINLASFLYDLNTNTYAWGGRYVYQPLPPNPYINGNAFVDACSLLTARYGGGMNYQGSLAAVSKLYAGGRASFANDHVDGYTAGPILTTASTLGLDPDVAPVDRTVRPWPGSDNTNHFFSPADFFDRTKTSAAFTNRLLTVGAHTDTYDRYTFYRLLSQMGTDSAPDPANKINLNYDNLVQKNVEGIVSATNFFPWRPMDFFTNTANALLANAGFNFTITNIQIYPTNYYTAGVHRLLQMALNIYDSTTNRVYLANAKQAPPFCPTVIRPLFRRTTIGTNNNVVIIAGYREVFGTALASTTTGPRIVELDNGNPVVNAQQIPPLSTPPAANERLEPLVSGMPLVVGVKKGFPNFNEFAMQTFVYVSRLMEFRRGNNPSDVNGPVTQTNLMYVLTITNTFGLEAWNSYSNAYPRNLQLVAAVDMTPVVTNILDNGSLNPPLITMLNTRATRGVVTNIPAGTWRGWPALGTERFSFVLPFNITNNIVFTNSTYVNGSPWLVPETHVFSRSSPAYYVPHWVLNLNTRMRYILIDTDEQRIIDYVNLNNNDPRLDITAALAAGADCSGNPASLNNPASQWCTNRVHNGPSFNAALPTIGMMNQISVGLGLGNADLKSFSMDPYSGRDVESAVDGFRYNLMGWSPQYPKDMGKQFYRSNVFYAPFDPYMPLYVHTALQANDPLVHYTIGDLAFVGVNVTNVTTYSANPPLPNIGQINDRYEPWGGNPYKSTSVMPPTQVAAKDPLVRRSDDWDFPTNKYPNIGWLGRVHRGTPWQTVYLKSSNILYQAGGTIPKNLFAWQTWTGNFTNGAVWTYDRSGSLIPLYPGNLIVNNNTNQFYPDAVFTLPTNDWRIVDLFTTAFNDNATRGQLPVNQVNLAAWSAVLAGVNILSNVTTSGFIEPAGVYNPNVPPPIVQIVNSINSSRTNFVNNTYQRLGDILAAPALTVNSPYLLGGTNIVNDAVVERIPQQVLGLLRAGDQPRFVIYSYGQTLRPAEHSIISSGQFLGMCTNYQITAEVATRAVVRIDGAPRNPHAVIENFNVLPPD